MDLGIEDLPPEMKDSQMVNSFIPKTPLKHIPTLYQPICCDRKEVGLVEDNWQSNNKVDCLDSGNSFSQETQCHMMPAPNNLTDAVELSPELNIFSMAFDSKVHGVHSIENDQISIRKEQATTENVKIIDDFVSNFQPRIHHELDIAAACTAPVNQNSFFGAKHIWMGGSSTSLLFELDPSLRTVIDSALPNHFEPITPEKCTQKQEKNYAVPDSCTDKVCTETVRLKNDMAPESMELNEKQKHSQLCATMTMHTAENYKPDKTNIEEVNLSSTPQQKPKKKRHRPKVVKDDQPRRTPKSKTGVKRKYVRKKGLKDDIHTPSKGGEIENHANNDIPTPMGTSTGKRQNVERKGINVQMNTPSEGEIENDENKDILTPEDTRTRKRRRGRGKGINDHINTPSKVGEMENDANKDVPRSTNIPTEKRKYVWRQEIHKPEATKSNQRTIVTRSSCKRSLNFDFEVNEKDKSSSFHVPSNCGMQLQETFVAKEHLGGSVNCGFESTESTFQVLLDFPLEQAQHIRSTSPSTDPVLSDCIITDQSVPKQKGMITFADLSRDEEGKCVNPINPHDSGTGWISQKQMICFKRRNPDTFVKAEMFKRFATGLVNDSSQAYCSILPQNFDEKGDTANMRFQDIYREVKTGMEHNAGTSGLQSTLSPIGTDTKFESQPVKHYSKKLHVPQSHQEYSSIAGLNITNAEVDNLSTNTHQSTPQDRDMLVTEELMKCKRAECPSDVSNSNFPFLEKQAVFLGKAETLPVFEVQHQPNMCMETRRTGSLPSMKGKKQPKRNTHVDSPEQGSKTAKKMKYVQSIDAATEQFSQLDLNVESSKRSVQIQHARTAYQIYYQEKYALVPYQIGGAVIPFDGSFKKVRKPRAKVELDDETVRVWNLLLENINNTGVDGTDEVKEKWWREERRVFSGRVDSFIARMHLIQGDRRFSPWKGSVLDSVVGVFLTQNVSDHLSSSAFMSVAARFPLKSRNLPTESQEKVDTKYQEIENREINHSETPVMDEDALHHPIYCEDSEKLDDFRCNDIGLVSIFKSPENSSDVISRENIRGQFACASNQYPIISHTCSSIQSETPNEDKRDEDDVVSSQNSEISSQNSSNSLRNTESTEFYKPSTFEEVPRIETIENKLLSRTFVQISEQEGNVLHRDYKNSSNFDVDGQGQTEILSPVSPKINCNYCTSLTKPDHSCSESTCTIEPQASDCFDSSQKMNMSADICFRQEISTAETGVSESPESESQCTNQLFLSEGSKGGTNFLTCSDCNRREFSIAETGVLASSESESRNTIQMFMSKGGPSTTCSNAPLSTCDHIEMDSVIVQKQTLHKVAQILLPEKNYKLDTSNSSIYPPNFVDSARGSTDNKDVETKVEYNIVNLNTNDRNYHSGSKENATKKVQQNTIDWDILRKQAQGGQIGERRASTMDSVDWEAVRCADVDEVAHTIRERGMNNRLAARIKDFLDRLIREHGSLDLEWLRDVPPDKAKEYLLSVIGLGLKSVECVRLLTLHHLAFPVDTNVGRIAVRLGWVPLQPLPESLQLHLLEMYPVLESIQKYLWPRLCKLDQRTLYELHYQMITFGKVFCTKSKPNCNACPLRGECRHFASAFASARLALPAPEDKSIIMTGENKGGYQNQMKNLDLLQLPPSQFNHMDANSRVSESRPIIEEPATPEPAFEVEVMPEPSHIQVAECDIENFSSENSDEIPNIQLNMAEFTNNLQRIMEQNNDSQEVDISKALVALTPEAALIPMPKLKNISRLRTEHLVYELPDTHPLLEELNKREADDPSPYLLAIWTPGETIDSVEPPERRCGSQECEKLCSDETCFSCNSIREADSLTVRGTLLIPCRTAMRGSFPLNGTYFQVNELFADHESSLCPIVIPRSWLWNLPRRTVYFGTSIPTIFKGLSTEGIQYCFWRGFVCVRGFDRQTRAPRPLIARLHIPASHLAKPKAKTAEM